MKSRRYVYIVVRDPKSGIGHGLLTGGYVYSTRAKAEECARDYQSDPELGVWNEYRVEMKEVK